jgi:hypothetical protein
VPCSYNAGDSLFPARPPPPCASALRADAGAGAGAQIDWPTIDKKVEQEKEEEAKRPGARPYQE